VRLGRGNILHVEAVGATDGIVCDSHHDVLGLDLPLRAKRKKIRHTISLRGEFQMRCNASGG
jgi:hypothetical protein